MAKVRGTAMIECHPVVMRILICRSILMLQAMGNISSDCRFGLRHL